MEINDYSLGISRTAGMYQKSIQAVTNGWDKEVLIDISDLQYFPLEL